MESKIDGLKDGIKAKIKGNMEDLKNGWKADMEALKNGWKADMEGLNNGFKAYMEGFKEGLTKLLQEMFPNGEKVLDETHEEKKRNVNHDFIDSNFGFKTHHIPNIDIRNFDGKDLVTWILQMEQYFDLHNAQHTQKVHIASLF